MTTEKKEFDQFVERMAKIRELSSPELYDMDGADDYSNRLRNNFETIGVLAGENRKMLDEVLYPLLEPDKKLSDELVEEMSELGQHLLSIAGDVNDYENLDLPIMTLVAEKLANNAKQSGSLEEKICRYDAALDAYYTLMNMTSRITTYPEISEKYKKRGLEIGQFFLGLLDKERFLAIPDPELRGLVLTDARFTAALYENSFDPEETRRNLELLERLKQIPDDPFYQEAMPDYDWRYYKIRLYGYFLQCTDVGNQRGFTKEQLERIVQVADETEALIATDPAYFDQLNGNEATMFQCARNRYYLGVLPEEDYRRILLKTYENRDRNNFSVDGNFANVLIPLEILCIFKDRRMTAADQRLVTQLYRDMNAYMFRMPSAGALSFCLEFIADVVNNFIEIPGGITFEDFCLQTLAALHPPTYIHSRMVGQIATCLGSYVVDFRPDLLKGFPGCKTRQDVIDHRERILAYIYHAAICHDFGKIPIIDTILVYGRRLLEDEFGIIKTHPRTGYEMLTKYASTRDYADVALGHHRFYDDSMGYPADFYSGDSPYKAIIDIVQCADCMDAATDSVGRSYNKGKTIDDYVKEVRAGSGVRYAPWLIELFDREDVCRDMDYLLTTGRQETYRDTYILLKGVKEKGN
ncbi:MAG: HD domain-containing protein [Lachnospiraceae bacterium]|nr:HD domain-containing protein [Lachnospiraceae bacterium]